MRRGNRPGLVLVFRWYACSPHIHREWATCLLLLRYPLAGYPGWRGADGQWTIGQLSKSMPIRCQNDVMPAWANFLKDSNEPKAVSMVGKLPIYRLYRPGAMLFPRKCCGSSDLAVVAYSRADASARANRWCGAGIAFRRWPCSGCQRKPGGVCHGGSAWFEHQYRSPARIICVGERCECECHNIMFSAVINRLQGKVAHIRFSPWTNSDLSCFENGYAPNIYNRYNG